MSRKTLFALLLVLLVMLAPYTVLPALLESVVARAFQNQFGLEHRPEVEIESDPAPMMYVGSFSKALILVQGPKLAGVKIESAALELDPFDVNILESVTSGTLSTAQQLSGELHLDISEDEALRLAQGRTPVPVQDIQLEKNEVVLKLALGFVSPVSVRGRPLLQNGTVVFEPQQVVTAPAGVAPTQVLALTRFTYPVSGLPFAAQASGLQVRKDHVILSGRIQNIPLGPPGG